LISSTITALPTPRGQNSSTLSNRNCASRARFTRCAPTGPRCLQYSELFMKVMRRYVFVDLFRPLGGAAAYPILTHNAKLHDLAYDSTLWTK